MQGKYFYSLTPFAPRGTFTLKLFDHESDMMINGTYGKVENDYLEMSCLDRTNGKCTGYLHWMDPLGNVIKTWEAVSGGAVGYPYLPPLPDSTCTQNAGISNYTATNFRLRDPSDANGGFCDPGSIMQYVIWQRCWSVDLLPRAVYDCNAHRTRSDLRIHPLPESGITKGCIGVSNSASDLRLYFQDYLLINEMKLIVH